MRLLIIEDERVLADSLQSLLCDTYTIDVCYTGKDGLYAGRINEYDAVILDLGLPDIPGFEVCRSLRAEKANLPILILTGDDQTEHKIQLLDLGADDYLVKPFSADELRARIRALMRRSGVQASNPLVIGDLYLDIVTRRVERDGHLIHLRRKEFDILEYLMRNRGRVMTRSMILEHVWDGDADLFTNAIDVHIKYLRDAVDRAFPKQLIKTIHGVGYSIEE